MAAGCCCVAADCPQGPADLISDGVNGRLLPSDASDRCWVQCLDELLRTPKERQRLAEEAILVRERYAQERLRDQMLKALQGVSNLA
jgi:glycosyltransferase involved in cell wall biosynthesis